MKELVAQAQQPPLRIPMTESHLLLHGLHKKQGCMCIYEYGLYSKVLHSTYMVHSMPAKPLRQLQVAAPSTY